MKNTNSKRKIVNRNTTNKRIIAGGIALFSLVTMYITSHFAKTDETINDNYQQEIILDNEEHGYYSTRYLDALRKLDPNNFDQNFYDIYKMVFYSFNDNTYKGTSIYIVEYDDGSIHLVDSNNSDCDLLTGETINAKKIKIVLFKESSLFYDLYASGIITNNKVELSDKYMDYIKNWDGEKHDKTVDLAAQKEATAEYKKKYGGK